MVPTDRVRASPGTPTGIGGRFVMAAMGDRANANAGLWIAVVLTLSVIAVAVATWIHCWFS